MALPLERATVHANEGERPTAIIADSTVYTGDEAGHMRSPVRHAVKIIGWDNLHRGDEHDVVFAVTDDHGRRQGVRFGLSDLELSSGQLDRFIATVLQRRFVKPEGIDTHFWRGMLMNQLVGRRVVLEVITTHRGVPIVVDWEAAPENEA